MKIKYDKKQVIGCAVLILLVCQFYSQIGLSVANDTATQQSIQIQQTESERSAYREEMKVVIGCPDQVDVEDTLTIYAAGIRDAKASYIKPRIVTMTLSYTEESATLMGVNNEFIVARNEGYLTQNGEWVTNEDYPVIRMAEGHLFKTVFPAMEQEIAIKITVEMEWIAPWNEALLSKGEKVIYSGEWRDFEQLLATQSESVASEFDAMNIQELEFKNVTIDFEESLTKLESTMDSIDDLHSKLGIDPSPFHFYLLNISTITDTRVGSGSYIDSLRTEDPELYDYYIDRLEEVNHAFTESLGYLDRKGVPYIITMVNYTYEDSQYNRSHDYVKELQDLEFNNYTYEFETPDLWNRYGPSDADWDDEHLEDCSWEFLLEGQEWTGHPYLVHEEKVVEIHGLSQNTWYNISEAPSGYEAGVIQGIYREGFEYFNIDPTYYQPVGAVQPVQWSDDVEIYDGYLYGKGYNTYNFTELFDLDNGNSDLQDEPYTTMFNDFVDDLESDGFTLVGFTNSSDNALFIAYETFSVEVNETNNKEFRFSQDISQYNLTTSMTIEAPGGYRKPDRAIIVNLMDGIIPMMNRIYGMSRSLSQEWLEQVLYPDGSNDQPHPNYNDSYSPLCQYYASPDSPDYIAPPTHHLYLDKNTTGWVEDAYDVDQRVSGPYTDDGEDTNAGYYDNNGEFVEPFNPSRLTFNLWDYIFKLNGFIDSNPFFLNALSKPFSRLIVGHNTTGADRYDFEYSEYNLTQLINRTTTLGVLDYNVTVSIFAFLDSLLHFTADRAGGDVFPRPTVPTEWYYVNRYGQWCESFMNGTMNLGVNVTNVTEQSNPDQYRPHEDGWTFTWYDNALSDTVDALEFSDYQVSPFTGPDRFSPVGAIMAGTVIFVQNSLANLTKGFGYCYGLMYFTYYEIYITVKKLYANMIASLQQQVQQMENEVDDDPSLQSLIDTKQEGIYQYQLDEYLLDESWDDLDLVTIDELLQKILQAYNDRDNPYTAMNNKTWIGFYSTEARVKAQEMRNILTDMSYQGKEWDQEAQKLPDDFQDLGLIEDIIRWIDDKVFPLIDNIEEGVTSFLERTSEAFQEVAKKAQEKIADWENMTNTIINNTADSIGRFLGEAADFVANATKNMGDKLFDFFNKFSTAIDVVAGVVTGIGAIIAVKWVAGTSNPISLVVGVIAAAALIATTGLIAGLGTRELLKTKDAQAFKRVLNDLGETIGSIAHQVADVLGRVVQNVKKGLITAMTAISEALQSAISAISSAFDAVFSALITMWSVMIKSLKLVVGQIRLILSAVNAAIAKLNEVFLRVIDVLNEVFSKILEIVKRIGSFIVDLIGQSFDYILDFTSDIFTQVRDTLEKSLLENKAFVKVADTLAPQLEKMRKNAGVLQYATAYGEMNEEIMLKWTDVLQPVATIQSADTGFFLYQMGDEFAEKLYFICEYKGQMVAPDDLSLVVQRYADLEAEFNETGSTILETDIPLLPLVDNSTGVPTEIEGIYYAEFFQGKEFDWFKENKNGTGEPDHTAIAPAGWYMTTVNATYESPDFPLPLNAMWGVRTYLFDQRYIQDAFPRIDLVNDGEDGSQVIEVTAGGAPVELEMRILNKMWSQPYVSIKVTVSTEGGIPITSAEYPEVQLNTEDGGEITKKLSWSPGRNSPSGEHDMIISVREYNGDVTAIVARVRIEQSNAFINLVYQWQFWVGLAGGIVGLIGLVYLFYKRNLSGTTLEEFEERSKELEIERQARKAIAKEQGKSQVNDILSGIDPSFIQKSDDKNVNLGKIFDNCSLDDAMDGLCFIPKNDLLQFF